MSSYYAITQNSNILRFPTKQSLLNFATKFDGEILLYSLPKKFHLLDTARRIKRENIAKYIFNTEFFQIQLTVLRKYGHKILLDENIS